MLKEKKSVKIDINKVVKSVQSAYGKDKGLAAQISTGNSIVKPTEPHQFVCWQDSPWSALTGILGIPWGYVVQCAGRPDSGKSSTAMIFMKKAQEQGHTVILWDVEGKFSAARFKDHMQGNPDELLIATSRMILDGADQVEKLISAVKEQAPDQKILVVWDSCGGSLAKNEGDDSLREGKQLAAAAKEVGQVMRAFVRLMEKYKDHEKNEHSIAFLVINQVYQNIGSVGSKESGGQKLEYFSSIILQLARKKDLTKVIKGVKHKIGIVTRAKVKKNHLFSGESNVAELDLVVTAGGIDLLSAQKVKNKSDDSAWEDSDDGEVELEAD